MLPVLYACTRGGSKFLDKQFTLSEGRIYVRSIIYLFCFFFHSPFFYYYYFLYIYINFDFSQVSEPISGRTSRTTIRDDRRLCVATMAFHHCHMYTILQCTIRVLEIVGDASKILQITKKWLIERFDTTM